MAAYYPVSLDLRGRSCVVVGGGAIAEGKVDGLLAACARVTVVAPALSAVLAAHREAGRLVWVARAYRPGDLAGAWLAIAATDEPAVNDAVWRDAEGAGVLAQVVDDPPRCHFILPSIVARGDLTVAVSTSGSAPVLAVRLRERIAAMIGEEHERFLALARRVRAPLARLTPDFGTRKRAWYGLVDSDVLERLRAGDEAGARARFVEWLGVEPPADDETPPRDACGFVCPAGRPCVPGCTGAGARGPGSVRARTGAAAPTPHE
ncbi:MAG TPA: bifunctional precorrin-2 dehydrogenase/sirohydrochlorin ferrochelatase, partial [Gemmatirosa sp.]